MNTCSDGVYANKEMKSPAPRRHGQSAIEVVHEAGTIKCIPVVFIAPDSPEKGQWIPVEIHRANKERRKAERRALYKREPLLLRKKILEKRLPLEDIGYTSVFWWRHQ